MGEAVGRTAASARPSGAPAPPCRCQFEDSHRRPHGFRAWHKTVKGGYEAFASSYRTVFIPSPPRLSTLAPKQFDKLPTMDHYPVRRTLGLTALVVIAESLAGTILLPFVVFMVRTFPNVGEGAVGFWCGVISTPFQLTYMYAEES